MIQSGQLPHVRNSEALFTLVQIQDLSYQRPWVDFRVSQTKHGHHTLPPEKDGANEFGRIINEMSQQ
jgi:hypothetical protein